MPFYGDVCAAPADSPLIVVPSWNEHSISAAAEGHDAGKNSARHTKEMADKTCKHNHSSDFVVINLHFSGTLAIRPYINTLRRGNTVMEFMSLLRAHRPVPFASAHQAFWPRDWRSRRGR
jgi:hypothetical protein